ncbi:MAG: DUF456 domain-containing protein [bacterium]
MDGVEILVWGLSIFFIVLGLVGVFVPALPGPFFIFAGVLVHKWFLPHLSWFTVAFIFILTITALLMDWICVIFGIKKTGASKWGVIGAIVGFFLGAFLSLPGMIVGVVLGAMMGEYFVAERKLREASITGAAVAIGMIVSGVLRLAVALVMVLIFMMDCVF